MNLLVLIVFRGIGLVFLVLPIFGWFIALLTRERALGLGGTVKRAFWLRLSLIFGRQQGALFYQLSAIRLGATDLKEERKNMVWFLNFFRREGCFQ